jgi:glycosyltransferase involved in cell wall biosynthesis
MKIVQVLFSGLGGHGSVAFSIVRGDRARAHRHGFIFYGIEPLAQGYDQTCDELGVTYEVVSKRPGLDLHSWAAFGTALRKAAPDVVILHSTNLIGPASAFARISGTPLVVVDHLSNQVKQRRDWGFVALALALADATVFLTREFAAEIEARLGRLYRANRVHVIGNSVDPAAFAPRAPRAIRPEEPLVVGMHARFSASKDHATLLRAGARGS